MPASLMEAAFLYLSLSKNGRLLFQCSVGGCEAGDGYAEGRAGYVVHADVVAEVYRGVFAAVFATTHFEILAGVASVFGTDSTKQNS